MIFELHFTLIMAGYSAGGLLLGSYMIHYTGASEMDLGFVFMIQPLAVFARPFICARADRLRSHKQLLILCYIGNSLAYVPFVVLPFMLKHQALYAMLTLRTRFWILVCSHVIGSFSFCGVRSLGDSLAVNYAKRVGSDFTSYRKFGALSFGICGFLLGQINQNWLLPDYVPAMIVYVLSMGLLAILVYLWPDEHFLVVSDRQKTDSFGALSSLPTNKEVLAHMWTKLKRVICCPSSSEQANKYVDAMPRNYFNAREKIQPQSRAPDAGASGPALSVRQQAAIFMLLLRRDFRISLFMLLLVYGGLVGYAPQNFVFTYLDGVCNERDICDAASLSGLVMLTYCLLETICYLVINALRGHLNHALMLQITLASLAFHYYFYGFLLGNLSPYFFLVESLHGLEYSISLWAGVELGYKFANEVEYLLPELIQKGIIRDQDDQELVKVSLMATMSACFTLVYDGVGTIIGALLCGLLIDRYSFTLTWICVGSMATIGFVVVTLAVLIGKCFKIRPEISRLKQTSGNNNHPAPSIESP